MSDKVVTVINTMCHNPQLISDVTPAGNEYYFRYKSHVFSILHRGQGSEGWGSYSLYIYPDGSSDLRHLASALGQANPDDIGVKLIAYHSEDYDESSMKRLYNLVKERYMNVDNILDDILSDIGPGDR